MRYFKIVRNDKVSAVMRGNSAPAESVEITEAEYNALLAEIRAKAELVDRLYAGEITLADVPTAWREEIQRRVNERIEAEGEAAEAEISDEEALGIIMGGDA